MQRVVIFVDYQNAYRRARDAFHNHRADPHWLGQVRPDALGALITGQRNSAERELRQVRMYRGLPQSTRDPKGYGAALRQIAAWQRNPLIAVITRPFRYPRNYPTAPPQEKGIDVQLALDFVMMAVRNEYDIGVLVSNDTDLRPALEEVIRLDNQSVEVVAWEPLAGRRRYRVRLSGQFANNQPYCHWIDQAAYAAMQDTTDYTQPAGR